MGSEKVKEVASPPEESKYLREGIDNPFFHPTSKKFRRLPTWLDHFNSKDLKTLFKCSAAVWIFTLFIVINPTLRVIGQATFFGAIALFMVPPSGVVFITMLGGSTLLIGVCLAWAWGVITMKAALATRPAADLNRRYAELQQLATTNTTYIQQASGQTSFAQVAIFDGFMLDTRVSVTYFCMIGIFIYFMARLRVRAPKLTLLSIFAMIISDIFLTIAPLVPQFQGTIPRTLIIPAAIAIGISMVCNIIFFPRSTSHVVLDGMQDLLKPMATFLEACETHFQDPSKHLDLGRLTQLKGQVINSYKELEGGLGFLALDFSMGRWSAQDVSSLRDPLRRTLVHFMGLVQLHVSRREFILKDQELLAMAEPNTPETRRESKAGHHQMTRTFDFRQRFQHPEADRLREESLKALAVSGADILDTCNESLVAIRSSLRNCNTRRWFKRPSPEECAANYKSHAATLDRLRKHKASFAGRTAEELWNPHGHLFDQHGNLKQDNSNGTPPATGLMLALVFEEKIYLLAGSLETLLARVVYLEEHRAKTRLWMPAGLSKLFGWALEDDPAYSGNTLPTDASKSDGPSSPRKKQNKSKLAKKSKDAETPTEKTAAGQLEAMRAHGGLQRSKSGQLMIGISRWFTSSEGLFALRTLVATIALGVVAVIPSTAGFFYREKGLWALIMAQTGMVPYAADFLFGLITRIFGTIIGAVIGLVVWYIGAGNGPGNPYGMMAIMAPFIVAFMWLRLFLSPAALQAVILGAATCYLVVGYSWDDTHIPSYGNPGVGYEVFWRRMLLVLIGFGAAAIVTFFPRPPSANRHYRRLMSERMGTVKNQFALFVSNCRHPLPDLGAVAEKTALESSEVLLGIEPLIQLTKLEFSTSNFDAKTLGLVCHLCMNLNQAVTQLLLYAPSLPEGFKDRFTRVTGVLEEQLIGDIMAVLTLVQQSLRSGEPLPMVLPAPLLARSGDLLRSRVSHTDFNGTIFNKELLAKEGMRQYCSAMVAFILLLSSIDEMVIVVKRAVGETSYVDLER